MSKAFLLLLVGLPPILVAMVLPGSLYDIREELDWRRHRDPYAFLADWPHGNYRFLALAELDQAQRPTGFIARLVSSAYGPRYLRGREIVRAVWNPEGTRVLTGSGTTAVVWDGSTGVPIVTHGPTRRRDAEDANRLGFGLAEVAWYQSGRAVAAMTSGPHSLWFFAQNAAAPLLLEGDGYEGLTGLDHRVAFIKNLEFAVVLGVTSGVRVELPHDDITTLALLPDAAVMTASRGLIQRWHQGAKVASIPIQASYNPLGFSSDGAWALVLAQRTAQLWSSASGEKRELLHDADVTAICATDDTVVTGTEAGEVQLWSIRDAASLRRFRASTERIDLLACAPNRLLTVSYDRSDSRVWDLTGGAQSGPVLDPAPPRISWIVRLGANMDFPGRLPRLAAWLETGLPFRIEFWALGALLGLGGAAYWLAKSSRT